MLNGLQPYNQAFDKVWHTGLSYKLISTFPHPAYIILNSYLNNRTFQVRYQEQYIELHTIQSGEPQGCILGPKFYSIHTADLPQTEHLLSTFRSFQPDQRHRNSPRHTSEQVNKSMGI